MDERIESLRRICEEFDVVLMDSSTICGFEDRTDIGLQDRRLLRGVLTPRSARMAERVHGREHGKYVQGLINLVHENHNIGILGYAIDGMDSGISALKKPTNRPCYRGSIIGLRNSLMGRVIQFSDEDGPVLDRLKGRLEEIFNEPTSENHMSFAAASCYMATCRGRTAAVCNDKSLLRTLYHLRERPDEITAILQDPLKFGLVPYTSLHDSVYRPFRIDSTAPASPAFAGKESPPARPGVLGPA
jgi:hypothetical protein